MAANFLTFITICIFIYAIDRICNKIVYLITSGESGHFHHQSSVLKAIFNDTTL